MPSSLIPHLLMILSAGLCAGLVCRKLHVSVLVGYLVAGTLLGPGLLNWIRGEQHEIKQIAEAGVFFLLFSIGLEFSLDELLRLGRHLILGGGVQMLLVTGPLAVLLLMLGASWQVAVLIAAATSFSSTVLVFKTLSEWGHSGLPHGRRAIGILLFQDAALVPLLLITPLLTGTESTAGAGTYAALVAGSLVFVGSVVAARWVLTAWVVPAFASYRSLDLITLFTLTSLGGVTLAAHLLGLPAAIGAFAAGLIFSGNRWSQQIDALVLPFRESFAAVFFVSLGLLADPTLLWKQPVFFLSALSGLLLLKSAAATVALRVTGLRWATSAGMGIGLAHVGEFAFVLVLLGYEAGALSVDAYQRIVSLGIASLILTPLLLKAGLTWIRSARDEEDQPLPGVASIPGGSHALVVGAGPIGQRVASQLETAGQDVCIIDFSPINLHPFAQQGFRTVSGDATQPEVLGRADAGQASIAVICVPHDDAALSVVQRLRELNSRCLILVRCRYQGSLSGLVKAGADRVVSEESQASGALVRMLHELTAR